VREGRVELPRPFGHRILRLLRPGTDPGATCHRVSSGAVLCHPVSFRREQDVSKNPRGSRGADRLSEGEEAVVHVMGDQIANEKRRNPWTSTGRSSWRIQGFERETHPWTSTRQRGDPIWPSRARTRPSRRSTRRADRTQSSRDTAGGCVASSAAVASSSYSSVLRLDAALGVLDLEDERSVGHCQYPPNPSAAPAASPIARDRSRPRGGGAERAEPPDSRSRRLNELQDLRCRCSEKAPRTHRQELPSKPLAMLRRQQAHVGLGPRVRRWHATSKPAPSVPQVSPRQQ
jgi:hypothetical protein